MADESVYLSNKEGYDRWSAFYDADDIPLNLLEERAVERDLGDVRGLKFLELGCGTGRQTTSLAKRGAKITGVDQSEGMLGKARAKGEGLGIEFLLHDIDSGLPFPDGTFDRVVSFLVLEHITKLQPFFAECARVCDEKGFIYFTVMHPAMLLKGAQARYTDLETGTKYYPKSFKYLTQDYVNGAIAAGLRLKHIGEYACDENDAKISERALKYLNWPLLLTLKFDRIR